jgi:hypothetical protein
LQPEASEKASQQQELPFSLLFQTFIVQTPSIATVVQQQFQIVNS